jgi:hypothetical protein
MDSVDRVNSVFLGSQAVPHSVPISRDGGRKPGRESQRDDRDSLELHEEDPSDNAVDITPVDLPEEGSLDLLA